MGGITRACRYQPGERVFFRGGAITWEGSCRPSRSQGSLFGVFWRGSLIRDGFSYMVRIGIGIRGLWGVLYVVSGLWGVLYVVSGLWGVM